MLTGLLSLILSAFNMIFGYITALFVLLLESSFFAVPLFYAYMMVRGKFDLPVLSYSDVFLILLGLKILKFSSFEMGRLLSNSHHNSAPDEEKNSDSEE